jgi:hypothetical protein
MKRVLLVAAGLAWCVLVNACGGAGSATPTAPTDSSSTQSAAPKPPPQDQAAAGTISMTGSSPGFGASLLIGECLFGSVTRTCVDGWRGTFDVTLDRDMAWAVLSVGFFDGAISCGYTADVHELVPAGQTVTFRPSRISLSDEFGFSTPCQFPATTTRMVAVLWSDTDWRTELRQELSGGYTFTRP